MPAKRYIVALTPEERAELLDLTRSGKAPALKLTRARILLKADTSSDGPAWGDARIAEALDVGTRTVERIRRRYYESGIDEALDRKAQDKPSRQRKLDGDAEARLIALACGKTPAGRKRWTLRMLAEKLVELEVVESVSRETVRRCLKKTNSSHT